MTDFCAFPWELVQRLRSLRILRLHKVTGKRTLSSHVMNITKLITTSTRASKVSQTRNQISILTADISGPPEPLSDSKLPSPFYAFRKL